jgi:hypothetical protein
MQCPRCGSESLSGVKFCFECGAPNKERGEARVSVPEEAPTSTACSNRLGVGIALVSMAFIGVLIGVWLYLGTPIPSSLVGLDLSFMGRQGVVTRDTTFYPGDDLQAVVTALVGNQLLGDVGGLCDQGITCEGRQIIKAGTSVRVVKEITMQNARLNVTFAHIRVGTTEGWVAATAIH